MDTLLFFLWSVGSVIVRFLPRVLSVSPSATCIIGFGDLCSDLATKSERKMVMNSCILQKVQLSLQWPFRDLPLSITIIHKQQQQFHTRNRKTSALASSSPGHFLFPRPNRTILSLRTYEPPGPVRNRSGRKSSEGNNIVAEKR